MRKTFNIQDLPADDEYVPAKVEDGKPVELRYSSAQHWRQCKRLWHRENVLGLRSKVGWQANAGSFVHATIELLLCLDPQHRELSACRNIMNNLYGDWKKKRSFTGLKMDDAGLAEWKQTAWDATTNLFDLFVPAEIEVVALEKRVEATLPSMLKFGGQLDLIQRLPTGGLRVLDWKTGSRRIDAAMPQVELYAWALQEELGDAEKVEEMAVAWLSENRLDIETFQNDGLPPAVEAHEDAYKEIMSAAIGMAAYTEAGEDQAPMPPFDTFYPPSTSALCGWCGHLEACPEGAEFVKKRVVGGRRVSADTRKSLAEKMAGL